MESTTSHKDDFQLLPLEKVEAIVPKNSVEVSKDKMMDNTTTKDDYKTWPVEPFSKKWTIPGWKKPVEKIDGTTTNSVEFIPYDIKPIVIVRPPSRSRKLEAKLSSSTQYNEDFHEWKVTERVKPIIRNNYKASKKPFGGDSTYSTAYIPYRYEAPKRIKKDNRSVVFPRIESPYGDFDDE